MGSAAPVASDFGGTAAATSAPLMAGASAAIPDVGAGFSGGFPATGDILNVSAPSVIPGSDDMLAPGATPQPAGGDPFALAGAYGAAPTADVPAATDPAQAGLNAANAAMATPMNPTGAYNPATAGLYDAVNVPGNYSPTTPASPSLTQQLTGALSSPWTKLALAGAPLAIGLSGIGQKLPASAQAAQANAQALANQGANLNPSQQAVLSQMSQNLTNQWKQVLYNQGVMPGKGGVPMSTQWPQIQALIDQQVSAAAQQMIQQNIQNALQGDQQLINIAQLQMKQDQAFQNTLQNATRALGTAAGLGGTTKTVTTTTTPTDVTASS